jgi:hypothetical protein
VKIDKRSRWTTLTPGHVLAPADRRPQHVLQIVSGQKPSAVSGQKPSAVSERKPSALGSSVTGFGLWRGFGHAWVRLIAPGGEVYSFGFYPDESAGIVPERAPGLCFPGMILHPDKYDRVATEQLATDIVLTPPAFAALVQHLEGLQQQRRQRAMPFSLTSRNCVHFVATLAAKAGVQVTASGSLAALCAELGPAPLRPLCALLARRAEAAQRVLFNQALYLFGGSRVNAQQWLPSPTGMPELVQPAGLEPLFATRTSVWRAQMPIWHTHLLRRWQQAQDAEVPAALQAAAA